MILPTGGPYDRVEYEIQKTSSLGEPSWMRSGKAPDEESARLHLKERRAIEELLLKRNPARRSAKFRAIRREIKEEVMDW